MKVVIKNKEITKYLDSESPEFSKYVSPILNLANNYAHATRPKVVGQMTELIKKFPGRKIREWEEWYLKENPQAIKAATEKLMEMVNNFKQVIKNIDKSIVENWVKDIVFIKTFIGLRFQEVILKKISEIKDVSYRLATPKDESKGIDGYLGNDPVSIKPITYKTKPALQENIRAKVIYYKKIKGGIEVEYE